ncbi:MAG: FAD-binding oxidoreductase [Aphanocapsa feldmannii 277cI]|uniref:FAD-binding oxidoreductase n=1 Tax=Aphanocapsa feldmannii 277cI TaxID=2507554 RepID=A0A524RVQ7_9CHRO|nr:MAG: FAD-binding oxidoreductase [Aphanocapsa feldmannii 277cI]
MICPVALCRFHCGDLSCVSDVTPARFADVTVVGAGLTGSLVALALAERGAAVQLIEAPGVLTATAFSYAGVPWWSGPAGALGELQAGALRTWQALSLRHGDLGVESCSLALLPDVGEGPLAASHLTTLLPHGPEGTWIEAEALRALEPRLRPRQQSGALLLPYARVALERWSLGLRRALRRLRVHRLQGRVCQLMPVSAGPGTTPVQLRCTDGTLLSCRHVVLCQGASIPELLPSTWLPQLRHSWAGALDLPLADRWRGPLVMALRTLRRQLETSSLAQRTAAWSGPRETPRPADAVILDPGLAPCSAEFTGTGAHATAATRSGPGTAASRPRGRTVACRMGAEAAGDGQAAPGTRELHPGRATLGGFHAPASGSVGVQRFQWPLCPGCGTGTTAGKGAGQRP